MRLLHRAMGDTKEPGFRGGLKTVEDIRERRWKITEKGGGAGKKSEGNKMLNTYHSGGGSADGLNLSWLTLAKIFGSRRRMRTQ